MTPERAFGFVVAAYMALLSLEHAIPLVRPAAPLTVYTVYKIDN